MIKISTNKILVGFLFVVAFVTLPILTIYNSSTKEADSIVETESTADRITRGLKELNIEGNYKKQCSVTVINGTEIKRRYGHIYLSKNAVIIEFFDKNEADVFPYGADSVDSITIYPQYFVVIDEGIEYYVCLSRHLSDSIFESCQNKIETALKEKHARLHEAGITDSFKTCYIHYTYPNKIELINGKVKNEECKKECTGEIKKNKDASISFLCESENGKKYFTQIRFEDINIDLENEIRVTQSNYTYYITFDKSHSKTIRKQLRPPIRRSRSSSSSRSSRSKSSSLGH